MSHQPPLLHRRHAWATAVIIAGILYASLFPFRFERPSGIRGPLATLLSTWRFAPGTGDFVSNILLYMPLGLCAGLALGRRPTALSVCMLTCAGAALSLAMELTQFYIVERDPAMSDVYANTTGMLFGALAASIVARSRRRFTWTVRLERRPFPFLLIACWLAFQLFPYVPVIDLHKYWRAVKPLIFAPHVSAGDVYYFAACWLAVGLMIETILGGGASRVAILFLIGFVSGARMLISGIVLSPSAIAGAVVAAVAWIVVVSQLRARGIIVAVVLTAAVVVHGLEPFTFQTPAQDFEWIPFRGFIGGSPEHGVPSFFQKVFVYGAMLWAVHRAGLKLRTTAVLTTGLVFGLSLAHCYIPGRSREITDALMVLIIAGVFRIVEQSPVASAPLRKSGQNTAALPR